MIMFLCSLFAFSQHVSFSTDTIFTAARVQFDPFVFEKTPKQLPVSIMTLGNMHFTVNVDDITRNPFSYDWTKMSQSFIDARFLNPYYRRQDANGRDLQRGVINEEMINNLLRRN